MSKLVTRYLPQHIILGNICQAAKDSGVIQDFELSNDSFDVNITPVVPAEIVTINLNIKFGDSDES